MIRLANLFDVYNYINEDARHPQSYLRMKLRDFFMFIGMTFPGKQGIKKEENRPSRSHILATLFQSWMNLTMIRELVVTL